MTGRLEGFASLALLAASCGGASAPAGPRTEEAARPCGAGAIADARALRAEGRLGRAARTLERALTACSASSELRAELDLVKGELEPRSPDAVLLDDRPALVRADALWAAGDARAALAAYVAVLDGAPWHVRALEGAGLAARALKQDVVARRHLDRAAAALRVRSRRDPEIVQVSASSFDGPIAQAYVHPSEDDIVRVLFQRRGPWRPTEIVEGVELRGTVWVAASARGPRFLAPTGHVLLDVPAVKGAALDAAGTHLLVHDGAKLELRTVDPPAVVTAIEGPFERPVFDETGRFVIDPRASSTIVRAVPSLKEIARVDHVELVDGTAGLLAALVEGPAGTIGSVAVVRLADGARVASARLDRPPLEAPDLAFDRRGTRVAWSTGVGVDVMDLATGAVRKLDRSMAVRTLDFEVGGAERPCAEANEVPEGEAVVVGSPGERCGLVRGAARATPDRPAPRAHHLAASLAGASVLWATAPGHGHEPEQVASWWQLTPPWLVAVRAGDRCRRLVSPLGGAMLLGTCREDGGVYTLEVQSADASRRPPLHLDDPAGALAVSDDGDVAWATTRANHLATHGPRGWAVRTLEGPPSTQWMRLSPDGGLVVVQRHDGGAVIDAASSAVVRPLPATTARIRFVGPGLLQIGSELLGIGKLGGMHEFPRGFSRGKGESVHMALFSGPGGKPERAQPLAARVGELAGDVTLSADGKLLFVPLRDALVRVYDTVNGAVRATFYPTGPRSALAFLHGGKVERLGEAGPHEQLACRFGDLLASVEVCEDELVVHGEVARALARGR